MDKYLIGVDLGTTGVKALLINKEGKVIHSVTREYPLLTPQPGWAEQEADKWWECSQEALKILVERVDPHQIIALGLTGQMHGAVLLDKKGKVIRPPILWCDQRTAKESEEIHKIFGYDRFLELTGNPALTGFTAPKILWVKKHEPDNFSRVSKILLPKDYLRFLLTGEFASDVSDASGTSLFHVEKREWCKDILKELHIKEKWLPPVYESVEITGKISPSASRLTGLLEGTPVVAGAGDQAASAFGCGVIKEGIISATLGTSGVIFASTDTMRRVPGGKLHSFCHAVRGKWHLMGVMLSAGGSFRWLRDTLEEKRLASKRNIDPYEILIQEASSIPPGSEGLLFLPYLAGERTPHQDPYARGVFFGLSLKHTKAHLIRSVLEGISFGLKDSLELMKEAGIKIEEVRITGGGAKSKMWRGILADVFGVPIKRVRVEEGAAYGAALLSGVGGGVFKNEEEATGMVETVEREFPREENLKIYEKLYPLFQNLYLSLKGEFKKLHEIF